MKKKTSVFCSFILIVTLLLAISGCDVNGDGNNGNNGGLLALARMDIEDANNLVIAPKPGTSEDELYKITDDGKVEEVTYFDEENKEMPMEKEPSAIYNAGTDYVIVCYGYGEGYLVRKSDGAVFSLKNIGIPYENAQINYFKNARIVQQDNQGNIYYRVGDYGGYSGSIIGNIEKINLDNPSVLTGVRYLPENDVPYYYCITSQGNAVYTYRGKSEIDGSIGGTRIKKANGGLFELPKSPVFWIGNDEDIKYFDYGANVITTVSIDNNYNVTTSSINTISLTVGLYNSFLLRFHDRTLIAQTGINVNYGGHLIYEVENSSDSPREVNISEIKEIKLAGQSDSYYYLSGKNSANQSILLKINPDNDMVINLVQNGLYDIFKMTISSDDIVTFNATRMFDGAIVIGEISASGQVKILDTTLNTEVIVLERIR